MKAIELNTPSTAGRTVAKIRPRRIRAFRTNEPIGRRILRGIRSVLPAAASLAAIIALVGGLAIIYFYNHYSAIVDRRIASGFWHSRSGIYAAPYKLSVGRRVSPEAVVERLRRSGYIEGDNEDSSWNGGFIADNDRILIKPNAVFAYDPQPVEINFSDDKITRINEGGHRLDEYSLEPEMLSGRTETRRAVAKVLSYDEIPADLRNAIIVAEDRRYFSHHGVDPKGIVRAFVANLAHGEVKQGGSTITQQLVKNTFLTPERSIRRKFAEAFLSVALERRLSKEEIFALYCNEIYLGQYGSTGVHGVEQAAHAYFGKDLKQLNLAESAAIAAMIKNPNRYSPQKDEPEADARRTWIIDTMGQEGLVPAADVAAATSMPLKLAPPARVADSMAPYFLDAARKELASKFTGDYLNTNFNMRVYSTIDTGLQSMAEQAVARGLASLDKSFAKKGISLQASLVALDPRTGHVLALVGGRNYLESQFDRATDAYRQPGSTFKPFVYAAALEHGFTEISLFDDRPMEFDANGKKYEPANYGDSYTMGKITMKTALAKSSNVVAVETAVQTGLARIAEESEEFGFENIEPYPSTPLGTAEVTPLQLAAAYSVFANGGKKVEPTFVDRVVSADDTTLYLSTPHEEQIIRPQTAYMITDMLDAVVERGTARASRGALGNQVAFVGKTGSSKDAWFAGYTPNLVAVVWIGTDNSDDIGVTGGEAALPIWTDFMKAAVKARPEYGGDAFPVPKGLVSAVVDPTTGMLADRYCPMREQVVVPSSAISQVKCLLHQPQPNPVVTASVQPMEIPDTVIEIPADARTVIKPRVDKSYLDEAADAEPPVPRVRQNAEILPRDDDEDGM